MRVFKGVNCYAASDAVTMYNPHKGCSALLIHTGSKIVFTNLHMKTKDTLTLVLPKPPIYCNRADPESLLCNKPVCKVTLGMCYTILISSCGFLLTYQEGRDKQCPVKTKSMFYFQGKLGSSAFYPLSF